MPKFLVLTIVVLSAAILFGFFTAAVMATELGLVIIAAIGALVVLSGAFQGAHLFEARHQ